MAAAEAGKVICLANKESLVLAGGCSGNLRTDGAVILPWIPSTTPYFRA